MIADYKDIDCIMKYYHFVEFTTKIIISIEYSSIFATTSNFNYYIYIYIHTGIGLTIFLSL